MDNDNKQYRKKYKLSNSVLIGGYDSNDKIYITFEKLKLRKFSKYIKLVDCEKDYNENILRKSKNLMKANNLYLLPFQRTRDFFTYRIENESFFDIIRYQNNSVKMNRLCFLNNSKILIPKKKDKSPDAEDDDEEDYDEVTKYLKVEQGSNKKIKNYIVHHNENSETLNFCNWIEFGDSLNKLMCRPNISKSKCKNGNDCKTKISKISRSSFLERLDLLGNNIDKKYENFYDAMIIECELNQHFDKKVSGLANLLNIASNVISMITSMITLFIDYILLFPGLKSSNNKSSKSSVFTNLDFSKIKKKNENTSHEKKKSTTKYNIFKSKKDVTITSLYTDNAKSKKELKENMKENQAKLMLTFINFILNIDDEANFEKKKIYFKFMYLYIYEIGSIWESKHRRSFSKIISSKSEYLFRCMGFFKEDNDRQFIYSRISHKDSSLFDKKSEKKKVSIKEFLKCSNNWDDNSNKNWNNWVDGFIYKIYETLNKYFSNEIRDKLVIKYKNNNNIDVNELLNQLKKANVDLNFKFDHKAALKLFKATK